MRSNRRCRRASAAFSSLRSAAACGAGVDPECIPDLSALMVKLSWHLDQHSARYARREGLDWCDGVPSSYAVCKSRPSDRNYYWLTPAMLDACEYRMCVANRWAGPF